MFELIPTFPDEIITAVGDFFGVKKLLWKEEVKRLFKLRDFFGNSVPYKKSFSIHKGSFYEKHLYVSVSKDSHHFKEKKVNIDALEEAVAKRLPYSELFYWHTLPSYQFGHHTAKQYRIKIYDYFTPDGVIMSFSKSCENYKYFLFLLLRQHYEHKAMLLP